MPLHTQGKASRPRILNSFDQSISRPGCSNQFPSHVLYSLMMMAVYKSLLTLRQFGYKACLGQLDPVRRTVTRHPLLVFDGMCELRCDGLDERAATRNVEHLHADARSERRR